MTLCAALAGTASAAEGDPYLDQCFSTTDSAQCTTLTPSLPALDVEVSPDGRHVYQQSYEPNGIRLFDRGAFNRLTPRPGTEGCYSAEGVDGCTEVAGLARLETASFDFELSPDGRSLYLTNGRVLHFRRNPTTGILTPQGCQGPGDDCTSVAPLTNMRSVEVSKDGQNVYVRGSDQLGVFQRNTTTGALTLEPDAEDCFSEDALSGCTDTYGLRGLSTEMDFSPDGRFLYYSIGNPGGVGFFQRAANGTLAQTAGPQGGCITTDGSSTAAGECATPADGSGPALEQASAATTSPSGKHVFVSGFRGTVVYARDPDVGTLTKVDCIAPTAIPSCDQRLASAGMGGAAVSPDGTRVVVGANQGGVGVYDFDESTGTLTQLSSPFGCFLDPAPMGCSTFPGASFWGRAAWAPDGRNFYAGANGPLGNFVLDYTPTCDPPTVAVPFETAVAAPLSCTDVNGHDITYEIVERPTNGVVAGINQTAQTVAYDPFSGFSGTDSFTYRGKAYGASGEPVTVTLDVAGEGEPVDHGAVDSDADGYPKLQDCNDSNGAVHPDAAETVGNGIDDDCAGGDAKADVIGDGTAGTVRLNKRRIFTLAGHRADCRGGGAGCAVKTRATSLRKRKIGGSNFTVPGGATKKIKARLTKKAFNALERHGKMGAKVVVKVTRGSDSAKQTVKVKLKPPR